MRIALPSLLLLLLAPALCRAADPLTYGGDPLPPDAKLQRNIFYTPDNRIAQSLDIIIPKSDKPLPVVIWVHAGGWELGSKMMCPVTFLAGKGYVVATINYRLSNDALYPAQIQDCKAAVRFIRANAKQFNIDPDRIGVAGASAGGHLVALLGTTAGNEILEGPKDRPNANVSSSVQCVCDMFGPTDMLSLAKLYADSELAKDPGNPVARLLGGMLPEKIDLAKLASPTEFVKKGDPPFLIIHGQQDGLVPVAQSQELNDLLKKAGVESSLIVVPNAGHGGGILDSSDVLANLTPFFDKYLKK